MTRVVMSLLVVLAASAGVCADPVLTGLKGWYKPETLTVSSVTHWPDSSGTSNDLHSFSSSIPTATGINSYRYVDFNNAQSYNRLQTGSSSAYSPAVGMNGTEFDVFVVAANYQSGDIGTISPDPCNSNDEKVCIGLYSPGWVSVWGGTSYLSLGSGHQGGALYVTKGTCQAHQSKPNPNGFIYEGIFGTTGGDVATRIDDLESTFPVESAPSWQPAAAASFGAVPRVIMLGYNFNVLRANLYEVLIYNRKLTSSERSQVCTYLKQKYSFGYENKLPRAYNVSGTVTLSDFVGDKTTVPVTIQLCGNRIITETVHLNSSGGFTLSGIESGVYDIWIKAPHRLTQQIAGVNVASDTVLPSITLANGDCNGDNLIDNSDVNVVKQNWCQNPLSNAEADINGDGKSDVFDLAILKKSWNAAGATPLSTTYVYYVATNGSDSWSGKLPDPNQSGTDGPFATIEKAKSAVTSARTDSRQAHIIIRGGRYTLGSPIYLQGPDSNLTIEAAPGEQVIISGGRQVTGWTTYSGSIKQASLSSLGMTDFNFLQMYYNGKRQPLARVPNMDPTHPRTGGFTYNVNVPVANTTTKFRYDPVVLNPSRWANPQLAYVDWFPSWNYYNTRSYISAVDTTNHIITVARGADEIWQGDRFYVMNVFEELDSPGEWYCNRTTETLYFWPPDGNLSTSRVTVPALSTAFALVDTGEGVNVAKNIRLCGLAFEDFRGTTISMSGAEHCSVIGCSFRNVGTAVWMNLNTHYNRVSGCDITQTGAQALGGGSYEGQSNLVSDHIFDNNYIYDFGWVDKGYSAIAFWCVSNCTITHNVIHDGSRDGISLNACAFSTVAYNVVHHMNWETEDTGLIGSGTSWGGWDYWFTPEHSMEARGNTFHHNLLHDSGGYGKVSPGDWRYPYYSLGIYMDLQSSGFHVHDNVIYNTYSCGMFTGGGLDNIYENNINADSVQSQFSTHQWSTRVTMARNKVRKNVFSYNNSGALYFMAAESFNNSQITFSQNLVYNHGYAVKVSAPGAASTWSQWTGIGQDAGSVVASPQFVNESAHNYTLNSGSPAFGLGFQQIELSGVGLYSSRDRYTWPCPEAYVYREF
ncbi:MAG: dockerin type I domain-containing protein [Armatimonadota bacterium]